MSHTESPLQFRPEDVDDMCMKTYPCCHFVNVNGTVKSLSGVEIAKSLHERGLPVEQHFREYLDPDFFKKFLNGSYKQKKWWRCCL